MKLSIQNWIVSMKDEITQVDMLREAGFEYADWDLGPYFYNKKHKKENFCNAVEYYTKLKNECDKVGLNIWMTHTVYPTYMDETNKEEMLFKLEQNFKITNILGAKYTVVHPMMPTKWEGEEFRELRVKENIKFYNEVVSLAKKYDVVVCIEDMYGSLCGFGKYRETACSRIDEMLEIFEGVVDKEYCGFCYDSGHSRLTHNDNYVDMIKALSKDIKVLHLHGNDGRFDLHMLPTDKNLKWDEVMTQIKETGFDDVYNFEIIPVYLIGLNKKKKLKKVYDRLASFMKKYNLD